MKKLIRILFTFLILAGLGILLITTRPSEHDFAQWYAEKNESGLGSFFDDAFIALVEARTETSDYLVFSIFELDGEELYVGILGNIFGRNSAEQAKQTLDRLIDQARSTISGQ